MIKRDCMDLIYNVDRTTSEMTSTALFPRLSNAPSPVLTTFPPTTSSEGFDIASRSMVPEISLPPLEDLLCMDSAVTGDEGRTNRAFGAGTLLDEGAGLVCVTLRCTPRTALPSALEAKSSVENNASAGLSYKRDHKTC